MLVFIYSTNPEFSIVRDFLLEMLCTMSHIHQSLVGHEIAGVVANKN
jgi:hypothetical protein